MPVKLAHRLAALATNFLKVEQSTPYGVSSAGIFQVEIPQSRVWPGTATKRACARGAFSEDTLEVLEVRMIVFFWPCLAFWRLFVFMDWNVILKYDWLVSLSEGAWTVEIVLIVPWPGQFYVWFLFIHHDNMRYGVLTQPLWRIQNGLDYDWTGYLSLCPAWTPVWISH